MLINFVVDMVSWWKSNLTPSCRATHRKLDLFQYVIKYESCSCPWRGSLKLVLQPGHQRKTTTWREGPWQLCHPDPIFLFLPLFIIIRVSQLQEGVSIFSHCKQIKILMTLVNYSTETTGLNTMNVVILLSGYKVLMTH